MKLGIIREHKPFYNFYSKHDTKVYVDVLNDNKLVTTSFSVNGKEMYLVKGGIVLIHEYSGHQYIENISELPLEFLVDYFKIISLETPDLAKLLRKNNTPFIFYFLSELFSDPVISILHLELQHLVTDFLEESHEKEPISCEYWLHVFNLFRLLDSIQLEEEQKKLAEFLLSVEVVIKDENENNKIIDIKKEIEEFLSKMQLKRVPK